MVDRRRFLKHAASSAAVAAGAALLPTGLEACAAPTAGRMLVGPRNEAVNIRARICGVDGAGCPAPALLNDGRYALSVQVLKDPAYSDVADVLATWTVADVSRRDYVTTDHEFVLGVDGKVMRQAGRPGSLSMPDPDVFRFEVRADDFAGPYDSESGSRRSELVARQQDGVGEGTVWASFCLVLGSIPGLSRAGRGIVHQWHSVDRDVGRTPVLFVDIANSELTVRTCSSARLYGDDAKDPGSAENGVSVAHFASDLPAEGAETYITLEATFGEAGHLNTWINGEQVVDTDTPIGYYEDLRDGSGRNILGYPHWGLYTTNRQETQVVHIANPEWGPSSLSQRVTAPRPVGLR